MRLTIYNAALIVLLVFAVLALYSFAKRKLDFRYVLFWLVLCILLGIIASHVDMLEWLAAALKVFYAPSLFFAAALVFILAFIFYITMFITDSKKTIVKLTQEVALLKKKIAEYENNKPDKK